MLNNFVIFLAPSFLVEPFSQLSIHLSLAAILLLIVLMTKMPGVREGVERLIKSGDFVAQFSRYGVVGWLGYLVNLGIFAFSLYALRIYYLLSAIIAIFFSISHNFTLHHFFSFRLPASKFLTLENLKRYCLFLSFSATGILFGLVLLFLLVEFMHLHKLFAQGICALLGGTINFLISRKFVFKYKEGGNP